jgi:large subunit ribosomal protein L3
MGQKKVTVRNLTVIRAEKDDNLLVVKGAVPGAEGGYLLIKKTDFLTPSAKEEKREDRKEEKKEEKKK